MSDYTITATAKGKTTVIKTSAANAKPFNLKGLATAKTYEVSITATTKSGTSEVIPAAVPVA